VALLEENSYFGMGPGQVTVMMQDKVPALADSRGRIATRKNDRFQVGFFFLRDHIPFLIFSQIEMKPHGHGDVHTLLLQKGLVKQWVGEGREWLMFFQDTNPLSFRASMAFLGASKVNGFAMNSMAVPRVPREPVGAICSLNCPDNQSYVTNVEYNQLAPLLAQQGGDQSGEDGITSPYPGNTNVLMLHLPEYFEVLESTEGVVPEFVNPKYADKERETFKSATRLDKIFFP
jgi:UDP-sugar pyrophosphorylase